MARILGLDPGTRALGWAFFDTEHGLLDHGAFTIPDDPALSKRTARVKMVGRLIQVRDHLRTLLRPDSRLDLVAVEQQFSTGSSADSCLAWVSVSCLMRALELGLPFVEVPRATICLRVAGRGNATKVEVAAKLRERFGCEFETLDQSDAVATALAGAMGMEG